ncbi:MAG: AAA family ATPase [Planctomycetota bacterium]
MEAVLLMGIQATGKSSFCRERFGDTHVRINLDMLRTRHREQRLLDLCCEIRQPFVVDNTNPTREDRARYVTAARAVRMGVVGYYFESAIEPAMARNAKRSGAARVPDRGILGAYSRLELPSLDEGFDALYFVRIAEGGFAVEEWRS